MKISGYILVCCCTASAMAQNREPIPDNNLTAMLQDQAGLVYSYTASTQTHDYSGNWDIDGDGQTDSVRFIGNGGAHLYYRLNIRLSSEKTAHDFPYICLDWPLLAPVSALEEAAFYPPPPIPQFVVADFDADGNPELFVHINRENFAAAQNILQKQAIYSGYLLLDYAQQKLQLRNFIP